jgi:beta-aspartyl-peptidase (threonine type)
MHSIVIHGGAGVMPGDLGDSQRRAFEQSLSLALDSGFAILNGGGSSLDAVTMAVRVLEDDPLFNAGRGSALTREGAVEMDASIMDGRDQKAGAVAGVRHVKNPVDLARLVMEKSRHVLLIGPGAEEFALEEHVPLISNLYFRTDARRAELDSERQGRRISEIIPSPKGTVGGVAFEKHGNLAAATSTGGMTNKRPGRVGDSPIIGAGTYAKNGVCAVSATGHGEYFIRSVAAYHIAAAVEYRGLSLEHAARELIQEKLAKLGGDGGVIAIDGHGRIAMEFNTSGMLRAARDSNGLRVIAIGR